MNDDFLMNRMHNSSNPHQGNYKKVLCVCSAGLLRSPTAAVVLAQDPFNFNTRAVGIEESFALIPLDEVHISWADEIVVMKRAQAIEIEMKFTKYFSKESIQPIKTIWILDIPDSFGYRDPKLVELIKEKYGKIKYELRVQ